MKSKPRPSYKIAFHASYQLLCMSIEISLMWLDYIKIYCTYVHFFACLFKFAGGTWEQIAKAAAKKQWL